MFTFLLVLQALVAALLVGVVLMQQSEGGGLGMGGSPSGLMSARGAANFLTRATGILAVIFVSLSIALAVVATQRTAPSTIDTSLAKQPLPAAPAPAVPLSGVPASGSVPPPATAPASSQPVVPLAAPVQQQRQPSPRAAEPARASAEPRNRAAPPPPVASTVTPSIPAGNAGERPVPVTGPPANSN